MRKGDSVMPRSTTPTIAPLYNTAVRSTLKPRPVMVRVPLLTPCRHEASDVNDGDNDYHDDESFLRTTAQPPRGSPAAVMGGGSANTPRSEATNLKLGSTEFSLTSPALRSLWPSTLAASGGRGGGGRRPLTASPTPAGAQCSTSALLLSPRPSPSGDGGPRSGCRGAHPPAPAASSLEVPKVRRQNGKRKMNHGDSEGVLIAVPPHRPVITPLQHYLLYDNDAQRETEESAASSAAYSSMYQRGATLSHGYALSPPLLSDDLQSRSSLTGGGGVDGRVGDVLYSAGEASRTSPTPLQFSLPRDDESSSSTDSTCAAQMPYRNSEKISRKHRMSAFSNRRVVFSLAHENEKLSTSEENDDDGNDNNKNINTRAASVPIVRSRYEVSDKVVPRPSSRIPNTVRYSTPQLARKHGLLIPLKNTIVSAFHTLQSQKKAVVLMEHEVNGRREIIAAYVNIMRGILVKHSFRRSLLLAWDEAMSSSTPSSQSCKVMFSSVDSETRTITPPRGKYVAKREKENTKEVEEEEVEKGRKYASAFMRNNNKTVLSTSCKGTANHSFVTPSQDSDVTVTDDMKKGKKRQTATIFSPLRNSSMQQSSQKKEKEGEPKPEQDDVDRFDVGRSHNNSDPKGFLEKELNLLEGVGKDINKMQRAKHHLESQIFRFLSSEVERRLQLTEEEAKFFHFLLRYHRLAENALHPSVIYLQEACQWQSILTEATNNFYRLQEGQLDLELQQKIQFARDYARCVALLVEEENQARFMSLQETEAHEYNQIARLFHLGLAGLLEVELRDQRRCLREIEEKIKLIGSNEMRNREVIWTEEIRRRGLLYRRFECEYRYRKALDASSLPSTILMHTEKEKGDVDTPIELSVISGVHDDHSCVTNIEIHPSNHMSVTTTVSNIKVPSTKPYANRSSGSGTSGTYDHHHYHNNHHVVVGGEGRSKGNPDSAPFFESAEGLGGEYVEREFFEWNPTSITLRTTTNNTTTGTTAIVVTGCPSFASVQETSNVDPSRPHLSSSLLSSSPQPRSVHHTGTTFLSGMSSRYITSATVGEEGDNHDEEVAEAQHEITAASIPVSVRQGEGDGNNASIENLEELPVDSSPSGKAIPSPYSTPKGSRHDVGISVSFHSPDTTSQEGRIYTAIPVNRHLIPCSLKKCGSEKPKRYNSTTPVPFRHGGRGRPKQFSRGTQITPPPKRPYRDNIIFNRGSRGGSASTGREKPTRTRTTASAQLVNDEPSDNSMSSMVSSVKPCTACNDSSRDNDCREDCKYAEKGGGEPSFENLEVFENIDDWNQTPTEGEYVASEEEDKRLFIRRNTPPVDSPTVAYTTTTAATTTTTRREADTASVIPPDMRKKGSCSTENMQQNADTFPDFSLSTMLETTAAGSVHAIHMNDGGNKENDVGDVISLSSSSSCTHSVSSSTGRNKISDAEVRNGNCINDEQMFDDDAAFYCRSQTEMGGKPFEQTGESPVDYPPYHRDHHNHYSALNYMRPTMSWRRQHEGLEWLAKPPLLSQRRSRSAISNCSLRSGSQRRRKEKTSVHHVKRMPFEEGPGVWGDLEIPRRPFGYDVYGNKAYKVMNGVCQQAVVTTTIYSPSRRRDAACRFMAEGSTSRSSSHRVRRSVSSHTTRTPMTAGKEKRSVEKDDQVFLDDPATLEELHGIIERRSVSPRRTNVVGSMERASTSRRLGSMTPSYVDVFYKLDREVSGRKRFLASLSHGPVLRESSPRTMTTTPHRYHYHHHHRHRQSEGGSENPRGLTLSPGTSWGEFICSPWSPQPKPWC